MRNAVVTEIQLANKEDPQVKGAQKKLDPAKN